MNIKEDVQEVVKHLGDIGIDNFFHPKNRELLFPHLRSLETAVSKIISRKTLFVHRGLRTLHPTDSDKWFLSHKDFDRVVETFSTSFCEDSDLSRNDIARFLGPVVSSVIALHKTVNLFRHRSRYRE